MRIVVNRELCKRCGLCSAICPEVLGLDEEHLAFAKIDELPGGSMILEYCRYAAADCPAGAIVVIEDAPRLAETPQPSPALAAQAAASLPDDQGRDADEPQPHTIAA